MIISEVSKKTVSCKIEDLQKTLKLLNRKIDNYESVVVPKEKKLKRLSGGIKK